MKQRISQCALLFSALMCLAIIPAGGQQAPTSNPRVTNLLDKLHSRYWSERSDALDEIRSDRGVLHSRRLQSALIELLDQENQGKDAEGEKDGGEEYAEYFSSLVDTVNAFADWNNPRQACILVYAGSDDYPSSPAQAAARARAAMPCLLKRSKSELATDRAIAGPMLVEAMQKARDTLRVTTAQAARQIILNDLQDPDDGVRSLTVDALGKFGGTDMIPALKRVAASDPSPEVDGHSIRKSAVDAIAAIQKRERHE
jgi:hypothetical protein